MTNLNFIVKKTDSKIPDRRIEGNLEKHKHKPPFCPWCCQPLVKEDEREAMFHRLCWYNEPEEIKTPCWDCDTCGVCPCICNKDHEHNFQPAPFQEKNNIQQCSICGINKFPKVICPECEFQGYPWDASAGGFLGIICPFCHHYFDMLSKLYNIYFDIVCSNCREPTIHNGMGRQCECKTLVNYYRKFRLWFWQVRTGRRRLFS